MDQILLEAAYKIETAHSPTTAWDVFVGTLARLKMDKVIYAARNDEDPPDWRVKSTLPDNWPRELTYDPEFSEPFVKYCCATFELTKIGPEYLDVNRHYIDDDTLAYVQKAQSFDWPAAIGIPTALKGSGRHGGFIVGNGMRRYDFERAVMPLANDLRTLCLVVSARLERKQDVNTGQPPSRPLSPREVQVVKLLSKGLRPKGISHELGIKEPAVRLYLRNARLKLGAATNQELIALFMRNSSEQYFPD